MEPIHPIPVLEYQPPSESLPSGRGVGILLLVAALWFVPAQVLILREVPLARLPYVQSAFVVMIQHVLLFVLYVVFGVGMMVRWSAVKVTCILVINVIAIAAGCCFAAFILSVMERLLGRTLWEGYIYLGASILQIVFAIGILIWLQRLRRKYFPYSK